MKSSPIVFLALWASSVLALPAMFVKETCLCEPVQQTLRHISPPLSCVRTAAKIADWRALSFHRPELADKFVDMTPLEGTKQHLDSTQMVPASHHKGMPHPLIEKYNGRTHIRQGFVKHVMQQSIASS
jgi:hypothetical protein